jgi:hypothetical protein
MARKGTNIKQWRKVLEDLVVGIDRVLHSPEHLAVYQSAHIHGVNVSSGNNFGKELKAAQKLLDETK